MQWISFLQVLGAIRRDQPGVYEYVRAQIQPQTFHSQSTQYNKLQNLSALPCYLRREIADCSVMVQCCPGKEMVLQGTDHHHPVAVVTGMHSVYLVEPRRRLVSGSPKV